jgi:hypothetical protein
MLDLPLSPSALETFAIDKLPINGHPSSIRPSQLLSMPSHISRAAGFIAMGLMIATW